jgi:hypothetical protein
VFDGPVKTPLKIHRAEGKPGQPLWMFQINRLFHVTRISHYYALPYDYPRCDTCNTIHIQPVKITVGATG